MKKVGIKAIILILFLLHIPLFASEWQKELDAAKALGKLHARFIVDVINTLSCYRKEACFGLFIVFHRFVVVQMIHRKIGKHTNFWCKIFAVV